MKRYVQVDNGVITAEIRTSGTFDAAQIPKNRTMLDVTDQPDVVIGMGVTVLLDGTVVFTPAPIAVPQSDPVQTKLDTVLTAVQAIQIKVGARIDVL